MNKNSIIVWILFLIIIAVATAIILPRYGSLSKDIQISRGRALAANLSASTASNFTLRKTDPSKGAAIKNCVDVTNIVGNKLPEGYQIDSQDIEQGRVVFCALKGPNIEPMQFSVIGSN